MLDQSRILAVADEIEARSPGFFDANLLTLDTADLRSALKDTPYGRKGNMEELCNIVQFTWESRGIRCQSAPASTDPIAQELLRGVRDATRDNLSPRTEPAGVVDVEALLCAEYTKIIDSSGEVCGYVRNKGSSPLLLLNSLGIPLGIWHHLLRDEHDYRVIVPILPSCDFLNGSMTQTYSAAQLASTLQSLLHQLALPKVDILAWCNAGRVGIELLRLTDGLIGKLILLSPTFRGGVTRTKRTSPYEDNLDKLFSLVRSVPDRAVFVSTMFRQPQPAPEWNQFIEKSTERAQLLFSMPRKKFDTALVQPMATSQSLVHFVDRTYLDEALSSEIQAPLPGNRIALIQGSNDSIVNNLQAREWLEDHAPGFTSYEISGAGHYIHDLQYPYLIYLLNLILMNKAYGADLPARIRETTKESL